MDRLDLGDLFADDGDGFNEEVEQTLGIDQVCSSTDWLRPSFAVWADNAEPVLLRSDAGFVALSLHELEDGRSVLLAPESMWGFGSPLLSRRPQELVGDLAEFLARASDWDLAVLPGLGQDSPLETALRNRLGERFRLFEGPDMTRCRVELHRYANGQTSKRRRELQRIKRRAADAGVVVSAPPVPFDRAATFDRILDIERRSWKGRQGSGLVEPVLQNFYRTMLEHLADDRIRVLFATVGTIDAAYILGHLRGTTYRGLQLSYDDEFAHLSLGSVLQTEEISRSIAAGLSLYDLGMDMPYKRHWATTSFTTRATIVVAN